MSLAGLVWGLGGLAGAAVAADDGTGPSSHSWALNPHLLPRLWQRVAQRLQQAPAPDGEPQRQLSQSQADAPGNGGSGGGHERWRSGSAGGGASGTLRLTHREVSSLVLGLAAARQACTPPAPLIQARP